MLAFLVRVLTTSLYFSRESVSWLVERGQARNMRHPRNGDGLLGNPPGIVVGRSADKGVAGETISIRTQSVKQLSDTTHLNSASLASLASGIVDMLMMSPCHT